MQAVQLHITHASRRLQYEAGSRLAAAWRAAAAAACTRIQLRAVNRWTDSAGRLGRCCCVSLHAMSHLGDQYNCLDARASHFAAGKLGPGGGLDRCCCASLRAMSAADVSSSLSDSVSVSSSSESVSSESLGCAPAAFGCASNNMEVALQKGGCPRHSASDSVSASLSVSSPWCPSAPAPVPTVAPSLGGGARSADTAATNVIYSHSSVSEHAQSTACMPTRCSAACVPAPPEQQPLRLPPLLAWRPPLASPPRLSTRPRCPTAASCPPSPAGPLQQ